MKPGVLCLLLLSGCEWHLGHWSPTVIDEYALTWYCASPEGCERMEEVQRIDRVKKVDFDLYFTSTQDESFAEEAKQVSSDTLGGRCSWMYFLSLFGHELEPSKFCFTPSGFELELSIPNQDPTTYSKWVVAGRDQAIF